MAQQLAAFAQVLEALGLARSDGLQPALLLSLTVRLFALLGFLEATPEARLARNDDAGDDLGDLRR